MKPDCHRPWLILFTFAISILNSVQVDFITELAAFRNRRGFKSRLENLFPTEYSGRCVTSSKSGRDICYPDLASLDYSCVSKNSLSGHRSIPPPRIAHGQYKALITKFRPHRGGQRDESSVSKPFLVVQYECHDGYELLDEAEFLFCREYNWHETVPVCIPKNAVAEYRRKSNPCQQNNGGCSHICHFISGTTVKCECPKNWEMQEDERTCIELEPCQVANGGCSHFCETDVGEEGGVRCSCPDGFMLRADERTCIEEIYEISEFLPEKPGLCPQVPFGHPDKRCASYCRRDQDCQGKAKCCSNGCANVCLDPEPGSDSISRPIPECTSTEGCRCVVLDESRQRCQCPPSILCHITRSPPEVTISPQGPLEIRPGASLNLTCTAVGYPHANLSWYRDSMPMEQQQGATTSNGHGAPFEKTSTKRLLIKELFKSTVFTCEAVNEVGSNSMDVEVIVTGPGSPPTNIQAKVTGTSVTIRWIPPTLPNGRMKGYQVYYTPKDARKPLRQWKSIGTMDLRLTLDDLEPQTRYFFRIMPYNERGSGVLTNLFSLKTDKAETAPVISIIEGDQIELEPGESANLTCKVLAGWPMPQLAWFYQGAPLTEFAVKQSLATLIENADESKTLECRASNAKGAANASVKVEVMGPGRAPGQIQYRVDGTDIEMSWGVPQFPNGELKGYIIYYTNDDKLPIEKWNVEMVHYKQATIIKDLLPQTTYYTSIKAFNDRGSGPLSDIVSFKTDLPNMAPKTRLVDQSTRVEVPPLGNVNLTCAASGQPEPTVKWKQDGEDVRSFGQTPSLKNETTRTIFIQRIVENTAFTCQASNRVGSDSVRVDVIVTGPGSPPENIEVKAQEDTIFLKWREPYITNGQILAYNIYYTTDRSLPMSNWSHFEIPSTGHVLQAILHDLEEETNYFVKINSKNQLGEGVPSQTYQISTGRKLMAPKASLNPPDQTVNLKSGDSYTVTCTAVGHPEPKLVWHRDGQPVGFRTIADDAKSISAVLTVENLLTSSFFECKAENDLGSSIVKVQIDILGPGSPPTSIKYLPYSTNIDLMWEPPDVPNGPITGYEIAYTTKLDEDVSKWSVSPAGISREHRITGLLPHQSYNIRMRALNDKGPGPWTPSFTVMTGPEETLPEITLMPNVSVLTIAPGSTVNITCLAEGFPEPMVTWFENEHPVSYDSGSEVNVIKENVVEPTFFVCKATNLFGTSSKSVGIHVTGPGEPPLKFLCDARGLSVHLSWVPPRITNGILQSFIVYHATDPSLDISQWQSTLVPAKSDKDKSPFYDLTLKNMPPSSTLYFRIRAVNEKGPGMLSAPIIATTEPKDYSINVTVEPGETSEVPLNGGTELRCFGSGYPVPKVSWRKQDKIIVEAKPESNVIFLDNISGPVSVECFATSPAGTAIKPVHVFPSEIGSLACQPVPKLLDGLFLLSWPDIEKRFMPGSNYTVLYTNQPNLPLHLWSSIETHNPKQVFFLTLQPDDTYFVRMKILEPNGKNYVVCDSTSVFPPRLPKQVIITRTKNRTVLQWGKIDIPGKKIEKIRVYYTYEIDKPFEKWDSIMVPPTTEEISITDIKPSTDYLIKLEFVTDQGEKVYSLQYEIKSPEFEYTKCELARCAFECVYDDVADLASCVCPIGQVLSKNNRTCFEFGLKSSCDIENGGCDHICHEYDESSSESEESASDSADSKSDSEQKNTTARCSCFKGYDLQPDKVTCVIAPTTTTTAIPTTTLPSDPCLQPLDIGTCVENIPSWFYDADLGLCPIFAYTGCGGNANRFSFRSACMDACSQKPCHQERRRLSALMGPPQQTEKPHRIIPINFTKFRPSVDGKGEIATSKDFTWQSLPTCDEMTGNFAPMQCDALGAECWCVEPTSGREVDGSRVNVSKAGGRPYCSSCQFDYDRTISEGDPELFVPSCAEEGHYSLVQCHARTGECWCVNQFTGTEVDRTRVPTTSKLTCPLTPASVQPEDFRVLLTDDDQLKFVYKFEPVGDVKKFLLYYTVDATDNLLSPKWYVIEMDGNFTTSGFERPNFLPLNRTYSMKLAAVVDTGLTNYSNIVLLKAVPNVPPQPSTIRVESLKPENVTIVWNRTKGIDLDTVKYNAYVENLNTGSRELYSDIHALDHLSLQLEPNTDYAVSIAAVGLGGESPRSNRIFFKTLSRSISPGTTPLSVTEISHSTPSSTTKESSETARPKSWATAPTEVETAETTKEEHEKIQFLTTRLPDDQTARTLSTQFATDELIREQDVTKEAPFTRKISTEKAESASTTARTTPVTPKKLQTTTPTTHAGETNGFPQVTRATSPVDIGSTKATPVSQGPMETTQFYSIMPDVTYSTARPSIGAYRIEPQEQWDLSRELCRAKLNQISVPIGDIVFVTDVSDESREKHDYDAIVDGVLDMVDVLLGGPSSAKSAGRGIWSEPFRVAYAHVGEKVETPVTLELVYGLHQQDINQLVQLVRSTEHLKGGSADKVSEALIKSRDILVGPGSRPEAKKYVILISDGAITSQSVLKAVEQLSELGIDILAVALSPEAENEMRSLFGAPHLIFGAKNVSGFHLNVAPLIASHLCAQKVVPAEAQEPTTSLVSITKGIFVSENEINIDWVVDESYNIERFEVSFSSLKGNVQHKVNASGQARSLSLSGLPFEDHIIYVKPIIIGPAPTSQMFIPLVVRKDSCITTSGAIWKETGLVSITKGIFVSENEINIDWIVDESYNIERFEVFFASLKDNVQHKVNASGQARSLSLSGLPFEDHIIYVKPMIIGPAPTSQTFIPLVVRKDSFNPTLEVTTSGAIRKETGLVSITKGIFVSENEINIDWIVGESYNIERFEVFFASLKDNVHHKVNASGQARSLSLSGLPFEDHIIYVKPVIVGPVPSSQTFIPIVVRKDSFKPILESTTSSAFWKETEEAVGISKTTPFSVPSTEDFSVRTPSTDVEKTVTEEFESGSASSTEPTGILTSTVSVAQDFETPSVTPYSTFTSSIPAKEVQVVPKCNCTCQMLIKLRRTKCFYDADSNSITDRYEEITIDLDQAIENAASSLGKNCTDPHAVIIDSQQNPTSLGLDQGLQVVPKERESDCPCIVPLYGELCPPGYSLKGGRCRDIDECAYRNGGCSHGCVNTIGSYYCACPPSMFRDLTDPKQCLNRHNYFKRLGQLLHDHLYNEMKSNSSKSISADRTGQDPNNGTGKATVILADKRMKFEWEWSDYLRRRRRF